MSKRKPPLGQHFLRRRDILDRIVAASEIGSSDLVVEVGPGMGDLTELLVDRAREVIAIELDLKLIEHLRSRFKQRSNLIIVNQDALRFPYHELDDFKVVANIPYYITKPLLFRLIEAKNLKSMTLTVQKEVAERLCAKAGTKSYSALSLFAQYRMVPEIKFLIHRRFFSPPPKVDSAVVKLDRREKPQVKVFDETLLFRIIKSAFGQRRKMLSNSLKSVINNPKEFLERVGIAPNSRAEELTIYDFARLANELCKICKEIANFAEK